ncbi:fido domain-containing protein [Lasiosphaeria hispida]|uniref:Fido domain-containing protein n=1 Tax=Lasiosphaeria hispida TaxID=260671 RepID=A0AAJ0HWP3_9PEZI|nr:fido domain-containing protein [Lasiosphaeria hispida]
MRGLSGRLAGTFSSGWPSWRSVRGGAAPNFTIRLAASLEKEALKLNLPADPAMIIADARKTSQQQGVSAFPQVWEALEQSLITLVYGSNLIETAGSNLRITVKLCRAIFRGEQVEDIIDEHDPEYKEHIEVLMSTYRKGDHAGVAQSRKEVIQHAKALSFIIDHVILNNEPISEALILETHRILYGSMGDDEVTPGRYREHEVAVSYSKPGETKRKVSRCLRASAVPKYMKDLVENLNQEITEAEQTENMDPYTLAARYHHQFVMVHPFGDGNGRMSRIIMNVLLLKYAGHITLFGSEGTEKDDYLNIVGRGRKVFEQEDMEVEFLEQTGHYEFARFVLAKSRSGLEQMLTWARRERNANVSK